MTLQQIWGAQAILILCPLLGGLPLIAWITYWLTGKQLANLATGNNSVSAAFYHGGKLVGSLAVLSEAAKGIAAVMLARSFFPEYPVWELIALIALVVGRYFLGQGAGTTNVVWGYVVHDWRVAAWVFLLGGIVFTLTRSRKIGKVGVLVLFPLITAILHPQAPARTTAAIALALLIFWIYQKIPDDLDLSQPTQKTASPKLFRWLQGNQLIKSLDDQLNVSQVGQKAATLSSLKRRGYSVPPGWILSPGEQPEALIKFLQPSNATPLVVRSSAIGEDSEQASAAGQYETVLDVTTTAELQQAIAKVIGSYQSPTAKQYRQERGIKAAAMAVLVQQQISSRFSGVAFSRDPMTQINDVVVIEAVAGAASQVVSGQVTPQQYRVAMERFGETEELSVAGEGEIPVELIRQVAVLARQLENDFHGIPQDIEWSYDGQTLWLLQSRPITTLLPIWTRQIAAEVIPGVIHPLTWSINRPLTCGVWGKIFTVVLGNRAEDLDFNATATLHYSRAYFNASLLGQIFRRMGLPPESLEFLTRGAKFTKPPLLSTVRNLPGLLRLLRRELSLKRDFERDYQQHFAFGLSQLTEAGVATSSPVALQAQIELILQLLHKATYYSILAPLSAALRQAIWRVQEDQIDRSLTPEVASLRSLTALAVAAKQLLAQGSEDLWEQLAQTTAGQDILQQFDQLVERYGYLSQVATDIAVPTWKEEPQLVRQLFMQLVKQDLSSSPSPSAGRIKPPQVRVVQRRVDLKGRVTEVYSQLLAHLRWRFVALEQVWLQSGQLGEPGDIFFLEYEEVQRLVNESQAISELKQLIQQRRFQFTQDQELKTAPSLVYGNPPPLSLISANQAEPSSQQRLQGIGASPGQAIGKVKVLQNLLQLPEIDRETILVVPYTDSGWAPILARAGGLIAEVGGRLSHGAIVAREYGIPAVMNIHNATVLLAEGTEVRIDGGLGIVEIFQ